MPKVTQYPYKFSFSLVIYAETQEKALALLQEGLEENEALFDADMWSPRGIDPAWQPYECKKEDDNGVIILEGNN